MTCKGCFNIFETMIFGTGHATPTSKSMHG